MWFNISLKTRTEDTSWVLSTTAPNLLISILRETGNCRPVRESSLWESWGLRGQKSSHCQALKCSTFNFIKMASWEFQNIQINKPKKSPDYLLSGNPPIRPDFSMPACPDLLSQCLSLSLWDGTADFFTVMRKKICKERVAPPLNE